MPRHFQFAAMRVAIVLTFACLANDVACAAGVSERPIGKVLGVLEDFDSLRTGPFERGHLDSWRWSEAERLAAKTKSHIDIVDVQHGPGKSLRVRIDDPKILAREPLLLLRLAPFLPPDADVVRVRIRVISGEVHTSLGGPTAYYANSDVFTETQTLRLEKERQWVDVEFRLNHPLRRNFRRAGFSTDAPRNYYTRWAQEPLGLYLASGTSGEFEIDRIDVVAQGEGRPFPQFATSQIKPQTVIADFEDGRIDRAFTLYMANTETEWFEQSWKREKPLRFTPTTLKVASNGHNGGKCMTCTGPTAEEVHCAGIRLEGSAAANAIAMHLAADAPDRRETLVGVGPVVPLDFLIFVAPKQRPFPWSRFRPPEAWHMFPGPGFDFDLSYRTVQPLTEVDFAIYQTRRYLKPIDWSEVVLPAADFTCVYGAGSFRERFVKHQPLEMGDVIAIAWISPWCRVGKRDSPVTIRLDDVRYVTIPGTIAEHRSFWQIPDLRAVTLTDETVNGIRGRRMTVTTSPP